MSKLISILMLLLASPAVSAVPFTSSTTTIFPMDGEPLGRDTIDAPILTLEVSHTFDENLTHLGQRWSWEVDNPIKRIHTKRETVVVRPPNFPDPGETRTELVGTVQEEIRFLSWSQGSGQEGAFSLIVEPRRISGDWVSAIHGGVGQDPCGCGIPMPRVEPWFAERTLIGPETTVVETVPVNAGFIYGSTKLVFDEGSSQWSPEGDYVSQPFRIGWPATVHDGVDISGGGTLNLWGIAPVLVPVPEPSSIVLLILATILLRRRKL